jgi:nucleotide-binding universal stress UspA family protein
MKIMIYVPIFTNILVPVDGSHSSFYAAMLASLIASRFKSKITVIHCISHGCMHPELKAQYRLPTATLQKLEKVYLEAGKKVILNFKEFFEGSGIRIKTRLITCEDPAETIIQSVKNEGYDLVIIGNRAKEQDPAYYLGSTTAKVVRHSECPVFIAKKKTSFGKILVAVDGSKHANMALDYAIQLAKVFGANLDLVHVEGDKLISIGGPEVADCIGPIGECIMKDAVSKVQGVEFTKFLEYGRPQEVIIKLSNKENVDTIVVGSRGLSSIRRYLLGSVSDEVSMHARSSILIVR